MGWTSAQISKDQAIAEIIRPFANGDGKQITTRKHTVNGSELWHIQDVRDASGQLLRSHIVCTIFECSGGNTAWKTMDESMGPCYYRCPLSYLAEVPDPGGFATEWREKVRSIQAEKSATASRSKTLQPGQIVTLPETFKPCRFRLDVKIKSSWRVTATETGIAYKMTPAVLSRAVSIEDPAATTDPEAALRATWSAQGVSEARQNELIAGVTAKAKPGAQIGPFTL